MRTADFLIVQLVTLTLTQILLYCVHLSCLLMEYVIMLCYDISSTASSSSARRCACVASVWPIWSRLIMTASLWLREQFCLITLTVALIERSLLPSLQFQITCHSMCISSLTRGRKSVTDILRGDNLTLRRSASPHFTGSCFENRLIKHFIRQRIYFGWDHEHEPLVLSSAIQCYICRTLTQLL